MFDDDKEVLGSASSWDPVPHQDLVPSLFCCAFTLLTPKHYLNATEVDQVFK